MRIAIDIDGTLNEPADKYELPMCEAWLAMNNIEYKKRDYNALHAREAFGLSKELGKAWMDYFFPINVRSSPVREGVVLSFRILKRLGHEILIVTRRDPDYHGLYNGQEMIDDTRRWFEKNGIVYDDIHFGCVDKAKICEEIGADIMIDDEMINIIPLAKAQIPCIVVKTKYNFPPKENIDDYPYIVYKDNWNEIREFLIKLGNILN